VFFNLQLLLVCPFSALDLLLFPLFNRRSSFSPIHFSSPPTRAPRDGFLELTYFVILLLCPRVSPFFRIKLANVHPTSDRGVGFVVFVFLFFVCDIIFFSSYVEVFDPHTPYEDSFAPPPLISYLGERQTFSFFFPLSKRRPIVSILYDPKPL